VPCLIARLRGAPLTRSVGRTLSENDVIREPRPKLSEVLKEIALASMRTSETAPSSDAAHAALLFAHIGWNRALGHRGDGYESVLRSIGRESQAFWSELRSSDPEVLIQAAQEAKLAKYPDDRRVILVCGIPDERIHVEWCEADDFPKAVKVIRRQIRARRPR